MDEKGFKICSDGEDRNENVGLRHWTDNMLSLGDQQAINERVKSIVIPKFLSCG